MQAGNGRMKRGGRNGGGILNKWKARGSRMRYSIRTVLSTVHTVCAIHYDTIRAVLVIRTVQYMRYSAYDTLRAVQYVQYNIQYTVESPRVAGWTGDAVMRAHGQGQRRQKIRHHA